MSSHHIIRENQEPALVLFRPVQKALLDQLCEWSPQIFAIANIQEWVRVIGLKVDVIFGTKNSIDEIKPEMAYQMPLKFIELKDRSEIFNHIDNYDIHTVLEEDFISTELMISKNLIIFNEDYKEYVFDKIWKKWKNEEDIIELVSGELLSLSKLKKSPNGFFTVETDGLCEIRSKGTARIREFF